MQSSAGFQSPSASQRALLGARLETAGIMPELAAEHPAEDRPVNAEISNLVVRLTAEYTGRGPTKARTTITKNTVSVWLDEVLTKGERTLADRGRGDHVIQTRYVYQQEMREELVAGVEKLMDRKVVAFMSANHIDPDMAVELFVLVD